MKEYDYWISYIYIQNENYGYASASLRLDHKITIEDLEELQEFLKEDKGLEKPPVILNCQRVRKGEANISGNEKEDGEEE